MARPFAVTDIHHHVGTAPATGPLLSGKEADRSVEEDLAIRLAFMDAHGIDEAVLLPASGTPAPNGFADRQRANTELATYRDREPSRLVAALGRVSPLDGPQAIEEIDRCILELGMKGMVWHHRFDGCPIDHPVMDVFLAKLAEHGAPAFVHVIADSTLEAPWRLEILADRFPEVQFVALDPFSSTSQAHWMPYLASKHPNIAFDTGILVAVGHGLDAFVERIGADRLCFGTDFYSQPRLFGAPLPLLELDALGFGDEQLRLILGGNAHRILGLG